MKHNSPRLTDGISRFLITVMGIVMMIAGIRLLIMGVDNFIQPIRHAGWVTTSANVTDISETVIKNNFFRNKRTRIHYMWTYEYVVDGTHYTGEFGPLANSVTVGKSIQIKFDPGTGKLDRLYRTELQRHCSRCDWIGCRCARVLHIGHPPPDPQADREGSIR